MSGVVVHRAKEVSRNHVDAMAASLRAARSVGLNASSFVPVLRWPHDDGTARAIAIPELPLELAHRRAHAPTDEAERVRRIVQTLLDRRDGPADRLRLREARRRFETVCRAAAVGVAEPDGRAAFTCATPLSGMKVLGGPEAGIADEIARLCPRIAVIGGSQDAAMPNSSLGIYALTHVVRHADALDALRALAGLGAMRDRDGSDARDETA